MLRSQKALGEYLTLPKLTLEEIAHNTAIVAEKYKYGEERGQYILYFAPVIRAKELVIVYIHGGGWIAGSPERYKFIGQKFAEMGYHTVSIGYRHSPANKYPAQAEDVFAGYCKGLITLMGKGVKTQHAVVVGSSAGGHLGGVLTYDKKLQLKYNVLPEHIKGFVSIGGILTFGVTYAKYTQNLLNALFEKEYIRTNAEPYSMVDGTEKTRVLCIHSANDPISEVENETLFVDKINSFQKGYAESYIIRDETTFHSNLVSGMFFEDPEDSPPLHELFRWLDALQLECASQMEEDRKVTTISTVIFDLDGTLLNTLEDLTDSVNVVMEKHGFPSRSLEEVRCFVGNGVRNLIELSIPDGQENPAFESCLSAFKDYYSQYMQVKTCPYEGIPELLDKLHGAGFQTAIVSNKFDKAVKKLSAEYFGGNIDAAIGESSRILKKPAPDCVYEALCELHTKAIEAIYVGDSDVDVRTAKNAGIVCVGVTWGFRSREVLEKEGADYIIEHPTDLIEVIARENIARENTARRIQ